jgi:flagellar biosynthesis protein FlhB
VEEEVQWYHQHYLLPLVQQYLMQLVLVVPLVLVLTLVALVALLLSLAQHRHLVVTVEHTLIILELLDQIFEAQIMVEILLEATVITVALVVLVALLSSTGHRR